ncbi:DUF4257 domain-containing protein [Bacillus lacus]|uniref:DUF4257 domain-containing protein n=1 Tax=Metabacillus lacus TaxID=1983721 RepID=A0A7X2J271_9BACI|nr:DUF4257 domain-containing protein [Metabacillus lacus]MRX73959.1 DUF4257 domain-containing protein [Metabacillus lacus]
MLHQLIVAFIIGGLMGVLGHVKQKGRLERPRKTKRYIYLGYWEEFLMGSIASILAVLSSNPESSFQLVVIAVVAGYSGEAVLRSFDFVRQPVPSRLPEERRQKNSSSASIDE